MLRRFLLDFSVSATLAGFVAMLVGFASAVVIVFQAATAAGANQAQLVSWIWALGIGMGVGCIGLSLYYRRPIIITWSTPGAALLATSLSGSSMAEAIGIFVFVAVLILLLGLSGLFDRLTRRIPMAIASAMLAGILVQFGFEVFTSMQVNPVLVLCMVLAYLLAKRWLPRYATVAVLLVGLVVAVFQDSLSFAPVADVWATPVWVTPEFNLSQLLGIGIPLFIVTMTSQNLPGVATLQASGYGKQPISPVLTTTGGINLILAPFGGYTFNLAAITAAICTSAEAHPDPDKRYIAGVSAGVFNLVAGVFAGAVVAVFTAFPAPLIAALAGLALLGTIAMSMNTALAEVEHREAALITFLVTASGMTFLGVASAFWGLVLGMSAVLLARKSSY